MISEVEAVQNWLENITYQMTKMSYQEQSLKLAGPIALLKLLCTRMAHNVNDEACQIFGGRAITKTGMGRVIEEFQKTYKFGAILGGSEEIMADLGVKMAMVLLFKLISRKGSQMLSSKCRNKFLGKNESNVSLAIICFQNFNDLNL
jgi:alkylation response protein AidB-like acyl-CoA dehydrogenase